VLASGHIIRFEKEQITQWTQDANELHQLLQRSNICAETNSFCGTTLDCTASDLLPDTSKEVAFLTYFAVSSGCFTSI